MSKKCFDHEGKVFSSVKELCKEYGVSESTYHRKIKQGYTLYEILVLKENKNGKKVKDHQNVAYPTLEKMCQRWGINASTYISRIKQGYSIERALCMPVNKI